MKNRNGIELISLKTNDEIVNVLKKCHKNNLKYITIMVQKSNNKKIIKFGLLVNKSQFKHSVVRNKIKRQLRNILIASNLKGGLNILFKPNSLYLNETYFDIKNNILNTLEKN